MKTAYYNARARKSSNLAAAGGAIQIAVALVLFIFPVPKICGYLLSYPPILVACDRNTYPGGVGDIQGVLLLGSMILAGAAALLSTRKPDSPTGLWMRWVAVLIYVGAFVLSDGAFRLAFLPGTLLIFLSAGLIRTNPNLANKPD